MKLFKKKKNENEVYTFTKKWITRLMWFGCIWITWSYILASYAASKGTYVIAESLSDSIVTVVLGSIIAYLTKSFFETFSEEFFNLVKKGYTRFSGGRCIDPEIDESEEEQE